MSLNSAFLPCGKTYQVATVAANTVVQVAITADAPCNQFLIASHEKTGGTGNPIYVRISTSATSNVALPTSSGSYGVVVPPGTIKVYSGPNVGPGVTVYATAISETGTPEVYVTPGYGT